MHSRIVLFTRGVIGAAAGLTLLFSVGCRSSDTEASKTTSASPTASNGQPVWQPPPSTGVRPGTPPQGVPPNVPPELRK